MNDEFRHAIADDILGMMEDAILSGSLDHVVLERAAMLVPCRASGPKVRRRRGYDRRSWN